MPVCKNCGGRITKFDKDICPICGQANPFEEGYEETKDVTSVLVGAGEKLDTSHKKKKMTAFLYSALIGFTGMQFFYLGYKKNAYGWIGINLVIILVSQLVFTYGANIKWYFALLITVGIVYAVNILLGLVFLFLKDYKDYNGELVK